MWKSTASWREVGKDPDYRFSLANERTFLAWIRTALAILAGAIALRQLANYVDTQLPIKAFSVILSVVAGLTGVASYCRWRSNEIAMRTEASLSPPFLGLYLAAIVVLLSLGTAIWFLLAR